MIRNKFITLFAAWLFLGAYVPNVSAAACPEGQLKDTTGICYDPCKLSSSMLSMLMMYETPAKKKQITKLLAKCKSN